jgi:WD40 repeat protein
MPPRSLRVRDAGTGKELRKVDLQRGSSWNINELLAFTPDGKSIAVTSKGEVIHLIDFESGRTIRDFPHENTVLEIAFSQDGKLMAGSSYEKENGDYFARLWEVETGKELRRFRSGKNGIRQIAFSSDAKTLATGTDDARLRLRRKTGLGRLSLHDHGLRAAAFQIEDDERFRPGAV